jgi:coenzyme F420-0:L-glutamate ligase/coenzyme F420-1:gamma-L-glutamate ligase
MGLKNNDILFARRSIRQFQAKPVAEETIRRLLEAAHAAPSAHNSRPWRFVVLCDKKARKVLAACMAAVYRRDAEAEGRPEEEILARNRRSMARIAEAPAAVLVCAEVSSLPPPESRRSAGDRVLIVQSVAAAVQNLLLAAHDAGLGACWIGAPVFCPQAARESLGLEARWEPQALILLGYPAENPERPEGKPLDEVVEWR